METWSSLLREFTHYLPVLIRIASFWVALPVFSAGVPGTLRVGFAAAVALLVAPNLPGVSPPDELGAYALLVLSEALVGLAMGLVVLTLLAAVQVAGQLVDAPLGFSVAHVLDPQMGLDTPLIARFKFVVALLVLFATNGHHALLRAVAESFTVLPVGFATLRPEAAGVGVEAMGLMFVLAVRMAFPVVAALFLADVALGLVARAVPQVNVFFLGIPMKSVVGLALLLAALPMFVGQLGALFADDGYIANALMQLMEALKR